MKAPTARHKPNQLRIIGGQWRGRKLHFPDIEGLRPTGDRIRETLFNWLAPELPGARCLDLFAGSGALGLECLSRGADFTLMLERNPRVAVQLRENLALLNAERGKLLSTDALDWLAQGNAGAPFDIVFVDPPFGLDLWQQVIDALTKGNWLSDSATVYVEAGRDSQYQPPAHWRLHRDKTAGQVRYCLYYLGEH